MKPIRLVALSALLTVGSFGVVTYTSCTKDECKNVTCLNGGTCNGGTCTCKSGIGGSSCDVIYRNLYAYTYKGNGTDNLGGTYTNHKLAFTVSSDTSDYTKMQMTWIDGVNVPVVTTPIVLSNNTSTGSVFTITSTVVDTFTYTGTGTINGSTASVTITEATPHGPAYIYTFSNFIKQ